MDFLIHWYVCNFSGINSPNMGPNGNRMGSSSPHLGMNSPNLAVNGARLGSPLSGINNMAPSIPQNPNGMPPKNNGQMGPPPLNSPGFVYLLISSANRIRLESQFYKLSIFIILFR